MDFETALKYYESSVALYKNVPSALTSYMQSNKRCSTIHRLFKNFAKVVVYESNILARDPDNYDALNSRSEALMQVQLFNLIARPLYHLV